MPINALLKTRPNQQPTSVLQHVCKAFRRLGPGVLAKLKLPSLFPRRPPSRQESDPSALPRAPTTAQGQVQPAAPKAPRPAKPPSRKAKRSEAQPWGQPAAQPSAPLRSAPPATGRPRRDAAARSAATRGRRAGLLRLPSPAEGPSCPGGCLPPRPTRRGASRSHRTCSARRSAPRGPTGGGAGAGSPPHAARGAARLGSAPGGSGRGRRTGAGGGGPAAPAPCEPPPGALALRARCVALSFLPSFLAPRPPVAFRPAGGRGSPAWPGSGPERRPRGGGGEGATCKFGEVVRVSAHPAERDVGNSATASFASSALYLRKLNGCHRFRRFKKI